MDVKNTFINSDLEEEVYMDLPPRFHKESKTGKVCGLRKSLYVLNNLLVHDSIISKSLRHQGYTQAHSDHTLFYKHRKEQVIILIVYVDDIIVTCNDKGERKRLKEKLDLELEMKDLGNLQYFLRMEIARSREGILVSQRKYILDLLKETGMLSCKPTNTPMDPYIKLSTKSSQGPVDREDTRDWQEN